MWFVSRLVLSPAVLNSSQMLLVSQFMLILQQWTHTALQRSLHTALQQSLHTALAGLQPVTPRPSMSWWPTWMRTWVDRESVLSQRDYVRRAANPSLAKYWVAFSYFCIYCCVIVHILLYIFMFILFICFFILTVYLSSSNPVIGQVLVPFVTSMFNSALVVTFCYKSAPVVFTFISIY